MNTSEKQLKNALGDKFQFSIANGLSTKAVRVAIATGNIDCVGIDTVKSEGNVTSLAMHRHNVSGLVREGRPVDTILDDAAVSVTVDGTSGTVTMGTTDSSKSISHAKEHLKNNPRWIKKITLHSNNTTLYASSMTVGTLNPFRQTPDSVIELSEYYKVEQYQNDKIVIELDNGQLQWNDDFFWAINVPAGVNVQAIVEFYD